MNPPAPQPNHLGNPTPQPPAAYFHNPPTVVYKSDHRSRVWRIDHPHDTTPPVVIKRFEYSPIRQLLARLLHCHPAQRERRANRYLRSIGLPVVPVIDHGTQRVSLGCKLWLATPFAGQSLHQRLTDNPLTNRTQHLTAITAAANLTADLIQRGLFFRDLKPSNIIINDDGQALLIDVASIRPSRRRTHALRMLALLQIIANKIAVPHTDQLRFLKTVLLACPQLGSIRQTLADIHHHHSPRNDPQQ